MAQKTAAPDGWYDATLVDATYNHTENGASILELEFDVGEDYYIVKEGIFLVSVPTGDKMVDDNRRQWAIDSVERLKEVYPEAVVDGKLQILAITNASDAIKNKIVRAKVTNDGKFSKAKVYPNKQKRQKISREDAMKMAIRDHRALASIGISIGDASAYNNKTETVVVGSKEAEKEDIPF